MSKYRLVAADLDNTLLRSDKTISPETDALLSSLFGRGVYFVPSTGRTHVELPDPVRAVRDLRYAITCNGGGVYDFLERRYIFSFAIDKALGERVLRFGETLPVYPTMVCEGQRYIRTEADGRVADYIVQRAAPGVVEKSKGSPDLYAELERLGSGLQKIFFYSKDPALTPEILTRLRGEFPELAVTTSGKIFVEVNAPGIDKGKTLRLLCGHLGIPVEESIAFGDAANDLGMLKAAGCAVVPENGTEEVKAVADLICESCNDDGVCKALMRLQEEGKL